jgi:uncharacterized protein YdeI (YjbR/CyaY-like superfamily)
MTQNPPLLYCEHRDDWRLWLSENFDKEREIWFVFPLKHSGKTGISYNDAVEEALCFGWIDSTAKTLDAKHKIQRFTPRNPRSGYSQSNKERLAWLLQRGMIHPSQEEKIRAIVQTPFIFPEDIMERLRENPFVWEQYQRFSEGYRRIRIAYIDAARSRPEEFEKRLKHFMHKTQEGKQIAGFGGIDKYY